MTTYVKDFISSGISSVISMTLFYPLEITKVRLQTNQSLRVPLKTYYYGLPKSLAIVFIEKGLKFSTFNYSQKNNYNFLSSIVLTTVTQSMASTPIEHMRINKTTFFNKNMYRGHHLTIFRDILFNYVFFKKAYQQKDFIDNLYSGLLATSLVTPIDVIKTKYQSGKNIKEIINEIKIKPSLLITGIIPRSLAVGGFYGLTYFLFQNF